MESGASMAKGENDNEWKKKKKRKRENMKEINVDNR